MAASDSPLLDAVVLGGGIAGLVAARDISAGGASVLVLEGRDRLGGRTWSRPLRGTDVQAELGGTWFSRALQPSIAAEITRYDLRVRPNPPFESAVWCGTTGSVRGPSPIATFGPLLAPARPALDAAVAEIRDVYEREGRLPASQDVAAASWIENLDVPLETREVLLAWMTVIGGGDPTAQSLLIMTADLAFTGFSIESSLEELRETFEDGTGSLVRALASDVRGDIRTEAIVVRVRQSDDRVLVGLSDGETIEARTAVVALPLNCLADVSFDPPLHRSKREAAAERHPGRSTKVLAVVTGFEPRTLGWAWGSPLQGVVGMHEVPAGRLVAGFDGLGALGDPNDPTEIEAALRIFAPDATVVATESHDWIADPLSQGTWLSWRPGWAAEIAKGLNETEARLAFAGSDLDIDGGGYIEGAITSGRLAAEAALGIIRR